MVKSDLMGEKKIKGKKREYVVDTIGNLHTTITHSADIADSAGGKQAIERIAAQQEEGEYPRLTLIMADYAYGNGGFQVIVQPPDSSSYVLHNGSISGDFGGDWTLDW